MCRSISRLGLFIVNGVTLAVGITLVVVGCLLIWGMPLVQSLLRANEDQFKKLAGDKWDEHKQEIYENILEISSPLGKISLVFGIFTALISFSGFFGAVSGMNICLYAYIGVIGGISIGLIICVIVYFTKLKGNMSEKAAKLYTEAARNYISFESGDLNSTVVAFIMASLQCCGITGLGDEFPKKSDHDKIGEEAYSGLTYPVFCCKLDENYKFYSSCPGEFTSKNSNVGKGCADPLKSVIEKYTNKAVFVVMAMIIVLLVLLVFASCSLKS